MTLLERLRDMKSLTSSDYNALVALVEAAQGMVLWDYVGDADPDAYDRLKSAVELVEEKT